MSALLTKQAGAGEGTDEQVEVYSARCACDGCKWQSLWHRDPAKPTAALARHMAAQHAA